ncbi:hypothetical protein HDU78_000671 [Chytriomyces hyalinus]|nr:hypothetical protein HDU78_000671 [Chytriomyces hyalinus]
MPDTTAGSSDSDSHHSALSARSKRGLGPVKKVMSAGDADESESDSGDSEGLDGAKEAGSYDPNISTSEPEVPPKTDGESVGQTGCEDTATRLTTDQLASMFATKILGTVLRSRRPHGHQRSTEATPTLNALFDSLLAADLHLEKAFWTQCMPLHIDVASSSAAVLLERWVVSYVPHSHSDQPSFQSQSRPDASAFTSELVLLAQSLYSYIRLMPLHSILQSPSSPPHLATCISTADGTILTHPDIPSNSVFASYPSHLLNSTASNHQPVSFSQKAKLRAYRFRGARSTFGTLHLSVVYDASASFSITTKPCSISSVSSANQQIQSLPVVADPSGLSEISPDLESHSKHYDRTVAEQNSVSESPLFEKTAIHLDLGAEKESSWTNERTSGKSKSAQEDDSESNTLVSRFYSPPSSNRANDMKSSDCGPYAIVRQDIDGATISDSSRVRLDENGTELVEDDSASLPSFSPVSAGTTRNFKSNPSASTSSLSRQLSGLKINTEPIPSPPNLVSKTTALSAATKRNLSSPVESSNFTRTTTSPASGLSSAFYHSTPSSPVLHHRASFILNGTQAPSSAHRRQYPQSFLAPLDLLSGSLVGSYEESILNGRMSSLPSKPLPFVCEVGCVAIGKCKNPALKCPKVLRLGFDACFYEFGDGSASGVGSNIARSCGSTSMQSHLKETETQFVQNGKFMQQQQQPHSSTTSNVGSLLSGSSLTQSGIGGLGVSAVAPGRGNEGTVSPYVGNVDVEGLGGLIWNESDFDGELEYRKNWIGGFRIPAKGQLQIIIKNAADTAVKVFLLPYDFRDMPPNTKTFLRQKTYTIAKPNSSSTATKASPSIPSSNCRRTSITGVSSCSPVFPTRDHLRDAIHIHFQCTSRKRIYITRTVRVVFAHRGLESDEKVRTVTEGPGVPRYSPISVTPPSPSTPSQESLSSAAVNSNPSSQVEEEQEEFDDADDEVDQLSQSVGAAAAAGAAAAVAAAKFRVSKRRSGQFQQHQPEEVLSVSPSRRSFLTGPGGPAGGMPAIAGSYCGSSYLASTPRRSSLGVSMMNFAGISLEDGSVIHRSHRVSSGESYGTASTLQGNSYYATAQTARSNGMSSSTTAAAASSSSVTFGSFKTHTLVEVLPSTSPTSIAPLRTNWMVPPSAKSSLSIALSLSSNTSSTASLNNSAVSTPKNSRSRCVSTEVLGTSTLRQLLDNGESETTREGEDKDGSLGGGDACGSHESASLDEPRPLNWGHGFR